MSTFTTIKVEFGSQLRRLAFDSDSSSWAAVRSQILSSYAVTSAELAQYALHYLDDEGDLISVNSDTEFAEAMRCAKQKSKILKLILSRNEKAATAPLLQMPNSSSAANSNSSKADSKSDQQDDMAALLKVAVAVSGHSDDPEIDVEAVADDDAADQQVEEMDLPLSRRDLLSKSPTLSEASDSSFVSINAQSLRDDLDEKDEQAIEGGNDSEVMSAAAPPPPPPVAVDDNDAKVAVQSVFPASASGTPSQPEFIATDRAVVQDVLKQLAEDPIQLKAALDTPKAAPLNLQAQVQVDEKQAQPETTKEVAKVQIDSATPVPAMKVQELRSVIEGVVNEKVPVWLEEVLAAVDNLDHADEDVTRVQQLTSRVRQGLTEALDKRQSIKRISEGMAKKMIRIMKQAEGKPCKGKAKKVLPAKDEEEKSKASPPSPPAATNLSCCASASPCASVSASSSSSSSSSSCSSSSACGVVVHSGITCDGCGMSPIRGVRFHCISCDQIAHVRQAGGFDLCESCEGKAIHQQVDGKAHVMIKIKIPTKVIVDIEAPTGPIAGPQVYDVLRVNADGTRTPFRTAQPVIALPPQPQFVNPWAALSSSLSLKAEKKCDADADSESSVSSGKLTDLENRIKALESALNISDKRKAEKQVEKEQKRKEKEERKKLKQEAAAASKTARVQARQKKTEEKIAARAAAAAAKKKAEADVQVSAQLQAGAAAEALAAQAKAQAEAAVAAAAHAKMNANMNAQLEAFAQSRAQAPPTKLELAPSAPPASAPVIAPANAAAALSAVPAAPTTAAAPAPAAPAVSAPAAASSVSSSTFSAPGPFGFTLPPFALSNMVNSITNSVSNAFNQNNNKPAALAQNQAAAIAPSAPTSASLSSSASSSMPIVAPSSFWSSPTVSASGSHSNAHANGKRTLADVRAPAFFPYIAQLRDLEAMGFDVDKSIIALRYYRGDMQKAINSML